MSGYIYLASPYSHPSARIRCERYWRVLQKAADIMSTGRTVFCPIAHSHLLADHIPDAQAHDFDFWMEMDLPILASAVALWVCCWPGWKESRGVQREIAFALEHRIPILYLDEEEA